MVRVEVVRIEVKPPDGGCFFGGGGNVSVSPYGDPAIPALRFGTAVASLLRPGEQCSPIRTQWGFSSPRLQQTKTAPQGCRFRLFGGGGGNRTPVRKPSTGSSTYLVRLFDFARITPTEQAEFTLVALSLVSVQATRTDTSLCE